jgi:hypothetical protein
MEISATDLPEKTTARLSTAHQDTMILGHYCEITAPVAQDHGVLGRPQPHAPDSHGRRSISGAWRPLLTVIMDGPAVRRA